MHAIDAANVHEVLNLLLARPGEITPDMRESIKTLAAKIEELQQGSERLYDIAESECLDYGYAVSSHSWCTPTEVEVVSREEFQQGSVWLPAFRVSYRRAGSGWYKTQNILPTELYVELTQ